ncbi:MAG TPA: cupredoxin domain-containing protein [Gaiellaceae bacterium]|nr:cupredoxin domain-containing protein [Gaiellaceae bacterium]
MKRGTVIVAALGVVLAVAAAGCGGKSSSEGSGSGSGGKATIAGQSANDHGTKSVSGETEMKLDNYYFEPTVLEGKPGQSVKLELENESKTEHNLTIPSQGIDKDVEAGEDATVTVKIPKSGVVAFYCKYHQSLGMAGALAVNGVNVGQGNPGTPPATTTTKGYGY